MYVCILKDSLVIVVDDSLKASHVSTIMAFVWPGVNLGVP